MCLPPVPRARVHTAAGVVADLITHPVSTVKTRLQVQGASRAGTGSLVQYRGIWHATSSIARAEGAAGLYKGVGIVVASAAPAQGLYFVGYDAARAALPKDYALSNFAAGCAAQLCGSLFWVPMDTVKERLQVEGQLLAVVAVKDLGAGLHDPCDPKRDDGWMDDGWMMDG